MGWLSTSLGGWGQFGGAGMGCGGSRITPFLGAAPLLGTGCFLGPGGWQGRADLWGPGLILCGSLMPWGYCPPALAVFPGIACTLRCLRESRPYYTGTWG